MGFKSAEMLSQSNTESSVLVTVCITRTCVRTVYRPLELFLITNEQTLHTHEVCNPAVVKAEVNTSVLFVKLLFSEHS